MMNKDNNEQFKRIEFGVVRDIEESEGYVNIFDYFPPISINNI